MADIALDRPQPGQRVDITGTPDDRLVLNFPAGDPLLERVDDALVFTFEDGGSISIDNFYTEYTSENMPDFMIDGEIIPGDQFFAAMGEALMPAAGPAAGAAQAARNGRYNTYDDSNLLNGISRLDGLDLSNRWGQEPVETLWGAADDGPNFAPEILTGLSLSVLDINVREAGVYGNDAQLLSLGGDANTAYAGIPTASGRVVATDRNPGDTLTFSITAAGGTVIDITAANTAQTITTQYGTITIYNDGTFTYNLNNAGNANALAQGQIVNETFTVTVTDNRGASASTDITVTITGTNDRPELTVTKGAGNDSVVEDTITSVNGFYAGSDVDSDDTPDLLQYRIEGSDANSPHTLEGTYGTLTLNPDGTYTYELFNTGHPKGNNVQSLSEGQTVHESFDVTVIDTHNSTDTKSIEFTITGTNDDPVITLLGDITLRLKEKGVGPEAIADNSNEAGLLPGNNYTVSGTDHAQQTFTVTDVDANDNLTFIITDDNYSTLAEGNISVDGNANRWSNGTLTLETDYGILTVTQTGTGNNVSYTYSFQLDNDKADELSEGDPNVVYNFNIAINDGHTTVYQPISIVIEPTNDQPLLKLDGQTGNVHKELLDTAAMHDIDPNAEKGFSGSLFVDDKDSDGVFNGQNSAGYANHTYSISGSGVGEGIGFTPNDVADFGTQYSNTNGAIDPIIINGKYGTLTLDPASGQYHYELTKVTDGSGSHYLIDTLGEGAKWTETFTITVTDLHGATDVKTISVDLIGTNDIPIIVGGEKLVLKESGVGANQGLDDIDPNDNCNDIDSANKAYAGELVASGTITITDIDITDTLSFSLKFGNNTYDLDLIQMLGGGGQIIALGYGPLTLTAVETTIDGAPGYIITYSYDITEADKAGKLDFLNAYEVKDGVRVDGTYIDETFTIIADDGHDNPQTKEIEVEIRGTNDQPTIIWQSVDLKEGSGVKTGGNTEFTSHDEVDSSKTGWVGNDEIKTEATGSLADVASDVDAGAKLTYHISLTDGAKATISQGYSKGTTYTLDTANVDTFDESGVTFETIKVTYTDLELGETYEIATIKLNTATGEYTVTLSEYPGGIIDRLSLGEKLQFKFDTQVMDEHGATGTHSLGINIQGSNDAPVLSLDNANLIVKEDEIFQASGTASNTDIDTGDTHTYGLTARDAASTSTTAPNDVTTQIQGQYGVLVINKITGEYTYTLNKNGSDAVQGLHEGETLTETFHVIVTDNNGAFDIKDLNVTIQGTNDAPIFNTGVTVADVTEAGVGDPLYHRGNAENAGSATFEGIVQATDKDAGDTEALKYYFKDGDDLVTTITTDYGTITIDPDTGKFKYELNNDADAVNKLQAGQDAQDKFTVVVTDPGGLTAEQPLIVNIHGTNDKPIIDSIDKLEFTEDSGVYTASGKVTAHDVDLPDDKSLSYSLVDGTGKNVQVIQGQYGYLTIDQNTGEYTYTLDNSKVQGLGAGTSITETFPVRVTDNLDAYAESTITITINGTDDLPSMKAVASLDEDASSVSGTIFWSDPDTGVAGTEADVLQGYAWNGDPNAFSTNGDVITVQGKYGYIEINLVTGEYTYHLDTSTTQHLNIGRDASEDFPLTVTTGNSTGASSSNNGSIHIDIIGTNDAPTFVVNGSITEGDKPITMNPLTDLGKFISTGKLDAVDVDNKDLNDDGVDTTNTELRFGFDTDATDAYNQPYLNPASDGKYGTLIVDPLTGEYQYVVNKYCNALQTDERPYIETFTVTVSDPHGGKDTVTITIEVAGDTISNGPGNHDYPTDVDLNVREDHKTTDNGTIANSDGPYSIAILDDNGNLIDRVQSVTDEYGTLVVNPQTGECTYYLNNGSTTVQSMAEDETLTQQYTIINRYPVNGDSINQTIGTDNDDSAQVTVTITGDNDAPVITSVNNHDMLQDNADSLGNMPQKSLTGQVTAIDIDKETALDIDKGYSQTYSLVDSNNNETLSITTEYGTIIIDPITGKYTYTLTTTKDLTADDKVHESFKVIVTDNYGGQDESTINVTITGTNNLPTLTVTDIIVTEDGTVIGTGTAIATDDTTGFHFGASATDNASTSTVVAGKYGTLFINAVTGEYEYRLNNALDEVQGLGKGESFNEVFYITVTDKHGATTTEKITVTVEGTNDTPILFVDSTLKVTEGSIDNVVEGTARATDKDVNDTLTFGVVGGTDGKIIDTYGKFEIDPATGKYTFTLDNDSDAVKALALGEVLELKYIVQVTDGTETVSREVTVTVIGTNSAPEVTTQPVHTLTEDSGTYVAAGTIDAVDPDHGAVLQYSFADGSQRMETAYGTVTLNPKTGEYTYTLKNDSNEVQRLGEGETYNDKFTVVVTDEHGASTTTEMDITIKGTNDDPVITSAAPTLTLTEDVKLTANGQIIATDVDANDVLTYLAKLEGSMDGFADSVTGTYGTLVFQPDGSYTYTLANDSLVVQALAAGQIVTEKFTVQVNDGHGGTAEQTITVNITGTNDDPVITSAVPDLEVTEATDPSVSGIVTATDVDAGSVQYYSVGAVGATTVTTTSYMGQYGTVIIDASTGEYTYTLDARADALRTGDIVKETFTVIVRDGLGGFANQQIEVTINGTNTAPTITHSGDTTITVPEDLNSLAVITGSLLATDPDSPDLTYSLTHDMTPATDDGSGSLVIQGLYGILTLNTSTGEYTYELNTQNDDVMRLGAGSELHDTFNYTVTDETSLSDSHTLTIDIGSNNTVLQATAGQALYGTDASERLFGTSGDDVLYGGGGDDILFGVGGNNYLDGGTGHNQLYGGDGNDILVFSASNTVMDGGAGIDFLVGADRSSLDSLLDSGVIKDVEVFVTGAPDSLSLTSLADFAAIGVTVNNDMVSLDTTWSQVGGDITLNNETYVEYTSDSAGDAVTLLVQKTLLENNQG